MYKIYSKDERIRYSNILNLFNNKKYDKLVKECTIYLEMYPNNVNVRFMRAKAYRALEEFDKSIADLKHNIALNDDNYSITELYYTYYYLNMYDEALELLPKMYTMKTLNAYSLALSELIMKKSKGLDKNFRDGVKCDYLIKQIKNYSLEEAINHIKNHTLSIENKSVFVENVNVEYLVDCIQKDLNKAPKQNTYEILEVYYFSVFNIGYDKGNLCNYIKVVVVPDSNNVVTMYPICEIPKNYDSPVLNYDHEKLFKKQEKVKTLSRIDKFNKRYNR